MQKEQHVTKQMWAKLKQKLAKQRKQTGQYQQFKVPQMDYLNMIEKLYPQKKKVIQKVDAMTRIPNNASSLINSARSWIQLVKIQKQLTPILADTQIREVMILYHLEAKNIHQQGKLNPQQQFLLNMP